MIYPIRVEWEFTCSWLETMSLFSPICLLMQSRKVPDSFHLLYLSLVKLWFISGVWTELHLSLSRCVPGETDPQEGPLKIPNEGTRGLERATWGGFWGRKKNCYERYQESGNHLVGLGKQLCFCICSQYYVCMENLIP